MRRGHVAWVVVLVCCGLAPVGSIPAQAASNVGVVTEFELGTSADAQPGGITAGPDGNLWFTLSDGAIGRITPAGTFTRFSAGLPMGSLPIDITSGPDGNLWFTDRRSDAVGRITPQGAIVLFGAGITPGAEPAGITAGPDGNLWFTETAGNRVGRITTSGAVTEFTSGLSPSSGPQRITSGPDGNLWFTEGAGNRIGRITTSGLVTEFDRGISLGANPFGITTGPDGNLWFTESDGARIGRITRAGVISEFSAGISPGSGPTRIATGPDGNLWFTERIGNRIGRITPAGSVTEFTDGITLGAGLNGIAAARDGRVWFTERSARQIGRVTTGVDPADRVVSLTGTGVVGSTLVCSGDVWGPASSVRLAWLRDGRTVAGRLGRTYVVTAVDVGRLITCVSTALLPGMSIGLPAASNAIRGRAAEPPFALFTPGGLRARPGAAVTASFVITRGARVRLTVTRAGAARPVITLVRTVRGGSVRLRFVTRAGRRPLATGGYRVALIDIASGTRLATTTLTVSPRRT